MKKITIDKISRGDWILSKNVFFVTNRLDAVLSILKNEKKWLWKNDVIFGKYMILTKNTFLFKNNTFELLDHHHELNQKKTYIKGIFYVQNW